MTHHESVGKQWWYTLEACSSIIYSNDVNDEKLCGWLETLCLTTLQIWVMTQQMQTDNMATHCFFLLAFLFGLLLILLVLADTYR